MTKRVTIAACETLMEAANHTHIILGKAKTATSHTDAGWQDGQGNLFAVSSGLWTDAQLAGVTESAVLQGIVDAGQVPEGCDLTKVLEAQVSFILFAPEIGGNGELITQPPTAQVGKIVAIVHENQMQAIEWLGLTRVPEVI
jgi:hypothetical protein